MYYEAFYALINNILHWAHNYLKETSCIMRDILYFTVI